MKESKLFLHTKENESELLNFYQKAISEAIELYIVSAYLTEWNINTQINPKLKPSKFKFIFGKDFGLSRKKAIKNVLEWLPSEFQGNFLVAEHIQGFHPKAIFWKNKNNEYYALIGSSNLTNAAFNSNCEANILSNLSEKQFSDVIKWISSIEKESKIVTKEWIDDYNQATPLRIEQLGIYEKTLKDLLSYDKVLISSRRKQLENYKIYQKELKKLISKCANGEISNDFFYENLKEILKKGISFQPRFDWSRRGKRDNFKLLCQALERIYKTKADNRDNIVEKEINNLQKKNISNRKALLSELLSLEYPNEYPLFNEPVRKFLKSLNRSIPKSTDGKIYIVTSQILRDIQSDMDKIENLAELDVLIQSKYR
jgi:hypothetical protein